MTFIKIVSVKNNSFQNANQPLCFSKAVKSATKKLFQTKFY